MKTFSHSFRQSSLPYRLLDPSGKVVSPTATVSGDLRLTLRSAPPSTPPVPPPPRSPADSYNI